MKSRGFSLVEMLAALAVLSVLLVLSWPALQRAIDASRNARCISNLRSCGQGILLHARDHENRLVLAYASSADKDIANFPHLENHPQKGLTWYEYLHKTGYLPNDEVFVCPSFEPYRFNEKPWGRAYGMRRTVTSTRYTALPLTSVPRPGHYLLLADSSRPTIAIPSQWYYVNYPGDEANTIHLRHQNKANIFFLDGSVRALGETEILDLNDGWNKKALDHTPVR
ncbi:MAG TPA: prepilin-type N-terminal cleavage/methylation domain-containing protein [Chthoniobacteraceae bacterium]|nr:prepilin-type N-terminal cleavage/methylation domain-containing protein [Chthoniobacteraceae bacterium]